MPVCGNRKYEPEAEECDNGNRPGCTYCQIEKGWSCQSQVGKLSACKPNVIIPHCGNGKFEPELGEECDDRNLANGDGCTYFCRVEPNWKC